MLSVSTLQVLSNVDSVVYAYSNSQAQSLVNDCGIDESSGINCANNGPLMQGEGLASSPIVTQSGSGQGPPGPAKELQVRTVDGESVEAEPNELTAAVAGVPPDNPTTWELNYFNLGPDPITLEAYAECAKLVDVA